MTKATTQGRVVNRRELAEELGVSINTVDAWRRRGCPVTKQGGQCQFNTADVHTWWRDWAQNEAPRALPADAAALRKRKLAAEAERVELEVAKARALVAPVADMERVMAMAFAEVRSNLRNLPLRVVTSLLGETSERKFKRILLAEIDQALEALADAELVSEEDAEGCAP